MELSQEVRAFLLLKAADMPEDSEKLPTAAATFEYKEIRETIMKIIRKLGLHAEVKEVNTGPEVNSSKELKKQKSNAKMHVTYELYNGQGNTATVLSKQLKRQEKYGTWINVQVHREEEPSTVNWDKVTRWEPLLMKK